MAARSLTQAAQDSLESGRSARLAISAKRARSADASRRRPRSRRAMISPIPSLLHRPSRSHAPLSGRDSRNCSSAGAAAARGSPGGRARDREQIRRRIASGSSSSSRPKLNRIRTFERPTTGSHSLWERQIPHLRAIAVAPPRSGGTCSAQRARTYLSTPPHTRSGVYLCRMALRTHPTARFVLSTGPLHAFWADCLRNPGIRPCRL